LFVLQDACLRSPDAGQNIQSMNRTFFPSRASAFRTAVALNLALLVFAQPALALSCPLCNVGEELPDAPMPAPQVLQIEILDGDNALNNIQQRTAREPIVQVTDENHKPVAGAAVLFAIRSNPNGAGGSFTSATAATAGTTASTAAGTLLVTTDALGRAQAIGLRPNTIPGKYYVTVTATVGSVTAFAVVHQENVAGIIEESSSTSSTAGSGATASAARHFPLPHSVFAKVVVFGGVAVTTAVVVTVVALTHTNNGATIGVGGGGVTHP
jgi:hypothetical protein